MQRCADHSKTVEALGRAEMKNLVNERDTAALVSKLNAVADRVEQVVTVFEQAMVEQTQAIRDILNDHLDRLAIADDPRSEEKN